MAKILFVCTGNITRSMTAHYLFQDYLNSLANTTFTVCSAGTAPAYSLHTFKALVDRFGEKGIDVTHHKVQPITQDLLDSTDYIICMTNHHRKTLRDEFGVDSYLFNELAKVSSEDVMDEAEAKVCSEHISDFLEYLFSYIEQSIPVIYQKLSVLEEASSK